MLESIVANFIRKLFGKYVESLNASQLTNLKLLNLKLESDIAFENLTLKSTTLDNVLHSILGNLPAKVVAGHLRELILKIPWTKLNSAPTYVHIRGCYLLIIPKESSTCSQQDVKIAARQAKKRQLAHIEAIKGRNADEKSPVTLTGKILSNLHVIIENLHVRYEDDTTHPACPFAAGVILDKLIFESEVRDIEKTYEPSRKCLSFEGLAFYWLTNVKLFRYASQDEWLDQFDNLIVTKAYENAYVVKPVTCRFKLVINSHPELDGSNFTIPKLYSQLTVDEFVVCLAPQQFASILRFWKAIKRAPQAKSSPKGVPERWRFAYDCVLEEIRCRRKSRRWDLIKEHLATVRQYVDLYACKLSQQKCPPDLKEKLIELEDRLDVFNIIQARCRAEITVSRLKNEAEKKQETEHRTFLRGLLSAILGGAADTQAESSNALTYQEKVQLLSAVDYEENVVPVYPNHFVATRVEFAAERLAILLNPLSGTRRILRADLRNVQGSLAHRPLVKGLELSVQVGNCHLNGAPSVDQSILLMEPLEGSKNALCVTFIKNSTDDNSTRMFQTLDISSLMINLQREALTQVVQRFTSDFIDWSISHESLDGKSDSTEAENGEVSSATNSLQLDVNVELLKIKVNTLQGRLVEVDASLGASFTKENSRDFDWKTVQLQLRRVTATLYPNYMELLHFIDIPSGVKSEQRGKKWSSKMHQMKTGTCNSSLSASVSVDESEIFLLEEDDLNSNALVMNVTMKLAVHQSLGMDLTATVPKLRGYSCVFDPARREDTMAEFLSPFAASVTCKMEERSAISVDISASNILLTLSPGTCYLLRNILGKFKSNKRSIHAEERSTAMTYADLWRVKSLKDMNLSFLEASETTRSKVKEWNDKLEMHFQAAIKGIAVVLETTVNNTMLPLVLVESDISLKVAKLFTGLDMDSSLQVQATYYNKIVSLWEPLVEPIIECQDGVEKSRSWKLSFTFHQSQESRTPTRIVIESADTLELTVTKGFFDVARTILEDFGRATRQTLSRRETFVDIYTIRNDLDVNIILDLAASELTVNISDDVENRLILKPSTGICLKAPISRQTRSVLQVQERNNKRKTVRVRFDNANSPSYQIAINRRSRRYFSFRQDDSGILGAVVEVCRDVDFNQRVTFRSVLKVVNHLHSPIDVSYSVGEESIEIGRLNPLQTLNVPPDALGKGSGLYFNPVGCIGSESCVEWKILQRHRTFTQTLCCNSGDNQFFIQVTGNVDESIWSDASTSTFRPCYEILLKPMVVINNLLPIPLHYYVSETINEEIISPGGRLQVTQVQLGHCIVLKIKDYLDREWTCQELLKFEKRELITWKFTSQDGIDCLDLGVYTKCKDCTYHFTVYCPFWMINNTRRTLTYKIDDDHITCHPPTMKMPILFCFPAKWGRVKKKAKVLLEGSSWSQDFSVDVAGSSFSVTCPSSRDNVTHNLGVNIQLGKKGLTRLVTFTPSYVVSNVAPFDVQVMEHFAVDEGDWIDVRSGDLVPIWPKQKEIIFRIASDPNQQTLPLSLDNPCPTLLRLDSEFGGIYVDFQVSESNVCIICRPYEDGRAPVLLVNRSWRRVKIREWSLDYPEIILHLEPQQATYYTWRHPNGSRTLHCSCDGGPETKTNILSDDSGILEASKEKWNRRKEKSDYPMQWVSFLYGRQRVLLFTKDSKLVKRLQRAHVEEPIQQMVSVSLHGLGLSLVDNVTRREILYSSISSSGIIWETGKYGKTQLQFRRFTDEDNKLLEDAYQKYLIGKVRNLHLNPLQDLDGGRIRVDFQNWKTSKPKDSLLRRSYHPGLELIIENSAHRRKLYGRLQRLQVDNQLDDCIFPVAFAPILPPPSITNQSVPLPFMQCFMVELKGDKKGDTMQIQNFQVRVQECNICIDKSLASALAKLFTSSNKFESDVRLQNAAQLNIDTALQDLRQCITIISGKAAEHYFGQLSLSRLKIHVSASWDSDGADGPLLNTMIGAVTSLVIKGLTGVQDAVFDLEGFEKSNAFLSWSQLAHDLRWHYVGQAVKNFYVFVFGLDALGNPVGLAKGITRGVEQLITEPIKGAMQGHDEFVEGLALGARNLFDHTVGGMASAASRITGALGENLAILTFDEEYKKQRRLALHQQPATIAENLAQGGKGLIIGVVDGVSGVIISPIKGAIEDGVAGFCCGALKGVLGLVIRPTSALLDCAHRSLRAILKKTDPNKSVSRQRPPRFLHPDGVVRPYQLYQADGEYLLRALDDGHYAKADIHVNHTEIGSGGKKILMVTNRRVIFMYRTRFGYWKTKSSYTWAQLEEPPQLYPGGLSFRLPHPKNILHLLSKMKVNQEQSGKVIVISSQGKCVAIKEFIEEMIYYQKELRESTFSQLEMPKC